MLGRIFQWLKLPGVVRPGKYNNVIDGTTLAVKTSPRYTILIVGGVEYFFLRHSGRFDGTGGMAVNRNVGL